MSERRTFRTNGGLIVERESENVPTHTAIETLIGRLDSERGVILASRVVSNALERLAS